MRAAYYSRGISGRYSALLAGSVPIQIVATYVSDTLPTASMYFTYTLANPLLYARVHGLLVPYGSQAPSLRSGRLLRPVRIARPDRATMGCEHWRRVDRLH